jgi:hypothetical protein
MIEGALRECLFCGSYDIYLRHVQVIGDRPGNGMRVVRCRSCGESTYYRKQEDAIRSWNTRILSKSSKKDGVK